MSTAKRSSNKLTTIIMVVVLSVILLIVGYALAYATVLDGNWNLYSTSAGTTPAATTFYTFNTTAPTANDTGFMFLNQATNTTGEVALGNSTVIPFSSIDPNIDLIPNGTWTDTFYGYDNSTVAAATLDISIYLLNSNGSANATIATNVGHTAAMTTSNQTLTNSSIPISHSGGYPVTSSMYLKITWYEYLPTSTCLNTTINQEVYSNVTGTLSFTGITGVFEISVANTWAAWISILAIITLFGVVVYVLVTVIGHSGARKHD